MNTIIAWFAENRVAANLLMVFIIVAGAFTIPSLQKEVLPSPKLNIVNITVPYLGASPSEVEEAITIPIERALGSMKGIVSINTFSREHGALLSIEGEDGGNFTRFLDDIKDRVGTVNFGSEVGEPLVQDVSVRILAASVVVYGNANARALRVLAGKVKQDLAALDNISDVELSNERPFEISIEIDEPKMNRYGLSFAEIAMAIKKQSLDIPVADIDTAQGQSSTIFLGEAQTKEQFEDLVVRSTPDGGEILIRDIANVVDGFSGELVGKEFDGFPAVNMTVFRVGDQDVLKIAEDIKAYVENPRTYFPEGVKIAYWQDTSRFFKSRIQLLLDNLVGGLALVFAVLVLFLRLKLSFWVSLGIPIAYLGAVWFLPLFGGTLNMISLFAFILVLGVVVDDAIIVGENVYTHQKNGRPGLQGAISGAQEVASPVIFAVLTTMVMFAPLLFLPGPLGALIYIIPVIVISILLFSLVESLLILPAHLSTIKQLEPKNSNIFARFQQRFSNGLETFISRVYEPIIEACLRWRYTTLSVFMALFFLSVAILAGGWVKTSVLSKIEADVISASVQFPQGTRIDTTREAVKTIERAAIQLKDELRDLVGTEQIKHIYVKYGDPASHKGLVLIELMPSEDRDYSGEELSKRWTALTGPIKGATKLEFESSLNKPGPPIDLVISAVDNDVLLAASAGLKAALSGYQGVYGVFDSYSGGKEEIRMRLRPVANELGVQLDQVALQARQAFQGTEVQRIQRGDDDVKVLVRYPESERKSLWHMENMPVQLRSGSTVPLASLAEVEYGIGPSEIRRVDGKRVIRIYGFVDESETSATQVINDLKANFLADLPNAYPGASWDTSGTQKTYDRFNQALTESYLLAALVIYILIATLFRSYLQPFMVLIAIPFGFVGALLGHLIMGLTVSSWTAMGLVAVSGVVINDNLVLVDYINRKRKEGVAMAAAIRAAGVARFRPIVLTSVTTFLGLLPLMSEQSTQAKFLLPMVVSLAFGVMFATFVTLLLVPALYFILDDVLKLGRRLSALYWPAKQQSQVVVAGPAGGYMNIDVPQNTGTDQAAVKAGMGSHDLAQHSVGHAVTNDDVTTELDQQFDSLFVSEASKPLAGSATSRGSKWEEALEHAFQQGFEQGIRGEGLNCDLESDDLAESWESGWSEGHEAYELSKPQ